MWRLDNSGNDISSIADPTGAVATFGYDVSGAFDTFGHLTQIFYPFRSGTRFVTNTYDPMGRVYLQANANGAVSNFYFAGSRTELIDPAGDREATYQTDRGKVLSDAFVLSSTFGNVFSDTTQQNGVINVTANQYDGLDRLTLTTLPEGGMTAYAYATVLNPWANNVASITRTAKPDSPLTPLVTSFAYNPIYNKPTSVTDPLGLVTTMTYDPATGNLIETVGNSGAAPHFNATSTFVYDPYGRVLSSTDPRSVVTTFAYDRFENLISQVADAGAGHINATTSFAYDSLGDVVATTDPNGNTSTLSYDADRRLLVTTAPSPFNLGPALVQSTNTYDPSGHLLSLTRSNGASNVVTSFAYTATGKTASTTDPNGNTTTNAYNADDRLLSVTDPVRWVTTYAYDAMSRKISVSNPAIQSSALVQFSYTPDGFLASLIDANSNQTSFGYDGFDRLSTATYPDSSTEAYTYDADSDTLTRKTRRGDTIAFAYNTLNRQCTKMRATSPVACGGTSSSYLVSYAYDLASRLIGVSDNSAAIRRHGYGKLFDEPRLRPTQPGDERLLEPGYCTDDAYSRIGEFHLRL